MARALFVQASYALAEAENNWKYSTGDEQATAMYIFPSQKQDAAAIVEAFRTVSVVSVTKRTKIGMDGLMIEVLYRMALSGYTETRILTGMNNRQWAHDMRAKTPSCFRDHIYHHGKLHQAQLQDLANAVVLVDEVDTGDKEMQVLHTTLKAARLLDFDHLARQNIKMMFASATMFRELYDLHKHASCHRWICLTVPPNYLSHGDFLKMGIIREHYAMDRAEDARRWLDDDVLPYGADYRLHLCRLRAHEGMEQACREAGVEFRAYTSDGLTHEGLRHLFTAPLTGHVVIAVKGFYRRATMIPNAWKLKIGATHELYTANVDYNVQIQGLPGRMTGYWKDVLLAGHVTGPHRCSTLAVENYEKLIQEPFGDTSYQAQGFHKGKLGVTATPTMLTGIAAAPSETPSTKTSAPTASARSRPRTLPSGASRTSGRASSSSTTSFKRPTPTLCRNTLSTRGCAPLRHERPVHPRHGPRRHHPHPKGLRARPLRPPAARLRHENRDLGLHQAAAQHLPRDPLRRLRPHPRHPDDPPENNPPCNDRLPS